MKVMLFRLYGLIRSSDDRFAFCDRKWKSWNFAFCELEQTRVGDDEILNPIMKLVWIPSKVKLFCWRLFLDWLSTRSQLSKKGIILNDHERICALSFNHEEDSSHLMLQCVSSKRIRQEINVWLDSDLIWQ
ncbi:unnamed protein product [Lathyrus oleraceus]